jgi:1,4-dihydroxy-2-naphthoate octaprenyltransferase
MMRKTHIRRPVAVLAMLVGAAMIFLGSETWTGIFVLALGVLIEMVGIAFSHKE